jgi:hypothetical protein
MKEATSHGGQPMTRTLFRAGGTLAEVSLLHTDLSDQIFTLALTFAVAALVAIPELRQIADWIIGADAAP